MGERERERDENRIDESFKSSCFQLISQCPYVSEGAEIKDKSIFVTCFKVNVHLLPPLLDCKLYFLVVGKSVLFFCLSGQGM